MTQHRDIDRLLDQWLAEGSTVAPDRVADVVAGRIERQYQRPAWLAGRNPLMTSTLRLVAALAAIAIVGAGAIYIAGRVVPPDVGHTPPEPTAGPSPSIVANTSSAAVTSVTFEPAIRMQLPVGWLIAGDEARAFRLSTTTAFAGPAGGIEFKGAPVVASNANECEGLAAPGVGTSVAELVASVSSAPQFSVVAAAPITLDGRVAQVIDIALAPGWTATCAWSAGQRASLLFTVADPPGPFYGLIGNERVRAILLDVDGLVVAILVSPTDGADFDEFLAHAIPVVEGVVFTP